MSTTTMPQTVARTNADPAPGTSHLSPFLMAMVLILATGLVSLLLSGGMH